MSGDLVALESVVARPGRRPLVRYSRAVARAICARVEGGESLRRVCADVAAGMPSQSAVGKWVKKKPRFAAELAAARAAAGWTEANHPRGPGRYCEATARAIYTRLCAGESLTSICADPAMPAIQTVDNWRDRYAAFDELMMKARRVQAERFCEMGWEIAQATTPKDAHVAWVKLHQLRWMASVMAPKRYGRVKPVDGEAAERAARAEATAERRYIIRHFRVEEREDGARRVVSYRADPDTYAVVREKEGPWGRPRLLESAPDEDPPAGRLAPPQAAAPQEDWL